MLRLRRWFSYLADIDSPSKKLLVGCHLFSLLRIWECNLNQTKLTLITLWKKAGKEQQKSRIHVPHASIVTGTTILFFGGWRIWRIPNTQGSLRQLRVLKHLADALLDVLVANAPVGAESKTLKKLIALNVNLLKNYCLECQLSFWHDPYFRTWLPKCWLDAIK